MSCCAEKSAKNFNRACNVLDFAGAITLVALGALALTGHGGATINALSANNGAWAMIAGGLVTLAALHLHKQPERPLSLPQASAEPGYIDDNGKQSN